MRTPRRSRLVTPDLNVLGDGLVPLRTGRLLYDPQGKRIYLDTGTEIVEIGRAQSAIAGLSPEQVAAPPEETSPWGDNLNLRDALRRIRNVIVQITGEAWGTVSTSLAWLRGRFHGSTGHTHSGAADDAPPVPWANIAGKPSVFPPEVSSSPPQPVGTSPSAGSSPLAARADHVHGLGAGVVGTSHLQDGAVTDAKLGPRTISDASAPTSDTGSLTSLLGGLANRIKAITGGASWRADPSLSLAALASHKARHAAGGPDPLAPADIGAAPATHTHSAADVTSGSFALSRVAKCAAIWGDETEGSSTSTTYTLIKEFRFYINRSVLGFANQLFVVVEMRNSGAYTTFAGIYIDGALRSEASVYGTNYQVTTLTIDITNLADGLHTISLYGRVNGGQGYWRYWEVWALG